MAGRARLHGREPLLHSFVPRLTGLAYGERTRVRWQPDPRQPPPVVLLTGRHGMGRSAVLDDLAAEYGERLASAYVRAVPPDEPVPAPLRHDGRPYTAASVVALLQELVCGLAPALPSGRLSLGGPARSLRGPGRRPGRHPFRLLLPGLFAASAWRPGEDDEGREACRRLARMLIACGSGRGEDAETLARTLAAAVGSRWASGDGPRRLTEALVELYEEYAGGRAAGLARLWYAEQQGEAAGPDRQPPGGHAPSPLVRLGMRLHQGGVPGRAAERTLVRALLRDVAAAYGPLQRANRERWPLVLLDDVHQSAGGRFLGLLLEDRAQQDRPYADHIVVVATQLGEEPEDAPDAARATLPQLAGPAAESAYRRAGTSPSAGLLAVPLPALGRDDIQYLLDRTDATLHPHLAPAVHALTDGHPEASSMLCDAVLDAAQEGREVTPAGLPDLRAPDGRHVTTALLERLLPHRRQRDGLVKLSLARSRSAAEELADHLRRHGEAVLDANAAADYLEAHRWQTYTTPDGPLITHPLLERLLLTEARRTMSATRWRQSHDCLAQHHRRASEDGDSEHEQWHYMAAGRAAKAASSLEERFELGKQRGAADKWLTLLAYCATAPAPAFAASAKEGADAAGGGADADGVVGAVGVNGVNGVAGTGPGGAGTGGTGTGGTGTAGADARMRIAMGEYDAATGETARREAVLPVTRLLHALWCLTEPHIEPDPGLCDIVGEELRSLSQLHSPWRADLLHAARTWPEAARRKRPFTAPGGES